MIVLLVVLFQILGILSSIHAVMSTRTPQGAIAWAVSLVTFPYVAVPAYWVFGRNKFNGYVLVRQEELAQLETLVRTANANLDDVIASSETSGSGLSSAERLARLPLTRGNEVELLINGEATFDSIFAGIDTAEEYLLVQFYIVRADELGNELKSRLIRKASEGLDVYFLYDEVGSMGLPSGYSDELRAAGVNVSPFHTRRGSGNRFQLNFRNHRKTVVADGRVAWIGGHNVGDEYLGNDETVGYWRDTHMRMEGPAVLGAQLAFAEDWRWATDEVLDDLTWSTQAVEGAAATALVIASGPADIVETASLMFMQAINSARQRIWIASPYFVPDDAIVQALQLASLRGVDVRILIPEESDNVLVTLAAYAFFDEVKSTGATFYRYQKGFLHEKVVLVDDTAALVGTANFDNRSFRLNFEITSLVIDRDFAADVEQMFEADFDNSRIMEPNEYDSKSAWFRLKVRIARLAAPVL